MQVLDVGTTPATANRWFRGGRLLIAIVVVAALAHLPGFVRTEVLNPDEAFLATQAQVLNDGGHLYRDVVDRKPPIVPYLYAAAFRVTGSEELLSVRLLALAAHVATALLLAALARRRWGDGAAFAAAMLYLVASGGLVLEDSQPANFEVFMLPFMTAAVVLADRGRTVGSGFAVGVATLTKQVTATTMVPVAYLAWQRDRAAGVVRAAAVFALTIAVVALAFGWADFIFWVFTGTGSYLDASGSWTVVLERGLSGFGLFLAANLGALLLVVLGARRWRRDIDLWLWLAAALVGVSAGFRFFGHYFLQLAPPFALLAAGAVAHTNQFVRRVAAGLAAASVVVFVVLALQSHPVLLHPYDEIAAAIDAHTDPGDHIFVWGQFPQAYWASGRRPATRFLNAGFLTGFGGGRSSEHVGREYAVEGAWADFAADLSAHPPALIVDASRGTSFTVDRFPEFASYLASHYERIEDVDGVVLYQRR